jgi:histidinol-phosphate phosphatase family protein
MKSSRTFAITWTGARHEDRYRLTNLMADVTGNKGLFLDLGGTLVRLDHDNELPVDARGKIVVELLPGVAKKLAPIRDHLLLIVTNQSKIKRGRFTMAMVEAALGDLDHQLGDIVTAWQICPHDDADKCQCRKPQGGMISELAELYGVDLKTSTMVGDQEVDQRAARAAGVGKFVYAKDFFGW